MMTCPCGNGELELVLDYCAGKLEPTQSRAFAQHMADCAECARLVRAQSEVWSALETWEAIAVRPDFNRRLFAAIEREQAERSAPARWIHGLIARWTPVSWNAVVPATAACVTVLAAVLIQGPAARTHQLMHESQIKSEKVDVEQVEQALDDLEMLNHLSDGTTASAL